MDWRKVEHARAGRWQTRSERMAGGKSVSLHRAQRKAKKRSLQKELGMHPSQKRSHDPVAMQKSTIQSKRKSTA